MPIQQISFNNTSLTKQTHQNKVAFTPVTTNTTGDTVEISSKKKENKILKYSLIGIGALLGIVAIAKYKDIAKIFKAKPKVKGTPKSTGATSHNSTPNSSSSYNEAPRTKTDTKSVPAPAPQTVRPKIIGVDTSILDKEELNLWQRLSDTKSGNYDQKLIGQLNGLKRNRIRDILRNTIEDVKYMQGTKSVEENNKLEKSIVKHYIELTDETKFTHEQRRNIQVENKKKNKTSNSVMDILIRKARTGDKEALKNPALIRHIESLKLCENIDVLNPPTLYRKVGKSELDALLNGEHILSNDPDYNGVVHASVFPDVWGGSYRVTFKPKEQFDLGLKNEWYLPHTEIKSDKGEHCRIYGGYTLDDVETIHSKDSNNNWTKIVYQSK